MPKRFCLIIFMLLLAACEEKNIMNIPIEADNFQDLIYKIATVCSKVDNNTCTHLKNTIRVFANQNDQENNPTKILNILNQKTPNEMIDLYKTYLLVDLKKGRTHDEEVIKNLNEMKTEYEKTKHFANNVVVSNISATLNLKNVNAYVLNFDVTNNTPFNIKQCVAEAEFYTQSDTFLGREKAFSYTFQKPLASGKTANVKIHSENIPLEDLTLIRATRNLKTKVIITSLQTDSNNDNESVLILALPYSYFKMRDLLKESDEIYNKTVEKIKAINSNR